LVGAFVVTPPVLKVVVELVTQAPSSFCAISFAL
jgi:hypothetical protein